MRLKILCGPLYYRHAAGIIGFSGAHCSCSTRTFSSKVSFPDGRTSSQWLHAFLKGKNLKIHAMRGIETKCTQAQKI